MIRVIQEQQFCFVPVRTVGMPSLVARCSLSSLRALLYNSARLFVAECQRFCGSDHNARQ